MSQGRGFGDAMRRIALYLGVLAVTVYSAFPIYWMALSSTRPQQDLFTKTSLVPWPIDWESYRSLLELTDYPRQFANSLVVALVTVTVTMVFSILIAYALTRLKLGVKTAIVAAMLFGYTFPPLMLAIPMFSLFNAIGQTDSLFALVGAHLAIALPLGVWLLWGFFKTMPLELEEAAMVDGCGAVKHAVKRVGRLLHELESYVDQRLPWPKLDFVAVPQFFGAMENVGLVTFESHILFDESDGEYGFATTQAVMAFQKYMGLDPSGKLDQDTANWLTVFPEKARGMADDGTLVEVDKTKQSLFIIENGKTIWTFNTSTGSGIAYSARNRNTGEIETGDAVTPNGLWKVNRERPNGWWEADLGDIYRPKYFRGGVAIHGMTRVPNTPVSHGCVRLSTAAMDFIWENNLVPLGTPVWVHE